MIILSVSVDSTPVLHTCYTSLTPARWCLPVLTVNGALVINRLIQFFISPGRGDLYYGQRALKVGGWVTFRRASRQVIAIRTQAIADRLIIKYKKCSTMKRSMPSGAQFGKLRIEEQERKAHNEGKLHYFACIRLTFSTLSKWKYLQNPPAVGEGTSDLPSSTLSEACKVSQLFNVYSRVRAKLPQV